VPPSGWCSWRPCCATADLASTSVLPASYLPGLPRPISTPS